MPYRVLGSSGLRVARMALGTGTFGQPGWGCTEAVSRAIYERYREAGGNLLDTANKYAGGESEAIVGRIVGGERDELVIGTKYTAAHPATAAEDPNAYGNHRKNLRLTLDRSLRRLGTDYVDILWVHAWDPHTPVPALMRALDDEVRAGRVLHIGASNMPAWVVSRANAVAENHGWTPFCSIQVEYSLAERGAERDLLPMARHLGLAPMAWACLGWGLLTGKYAATAPQEPRRLPDEHPRLGANAQAIATEVGKVAASVGATPAQVALAWVLSHADAPIVLLGARNVRQIDENLTALGVELPSTVMGQLEVASAIDPGVPTSFLRSSDGLEFFYGSTDISPTERGVR